MVLATTGMPASFHQVLPVKMYAKHNANLA
jgi:hypothetical protein